MTWNRDAAAEVAGAAMEAALKARTFPPDPITGMGGIGLKSSDVADAALPGIVASVTAEVRALHVAHQCRSGLPNSDCFIIHGGSCAKVGSCSACSYPTPCPTVRLLDDIDAAAGVV